jgi:hypothetical protein
LDRVGLTVGAWKALPKKAAVVERDEGSALQNLQS